MELIPGTVFELGWPNVTYYYSRRRLALEAGLNLAVVLLVALLGLGLGLLMRAAEYPLVNILIIEGVVALAALPSLLAIVLIVERMLLSDQRALTITSNGLILPHGIGLIRWDEIADVELSEERYKLEWLWGIFARALPLLWLTRLILHPRERSFFGITPGVVRILKIHLRDPNVVLARIPSGEEKLARTRLSLFGAPFLIVEQGLEVPLRQVYEQIRSARSRGGPKRFTLPPPPPWG